MSPRDYLLSYSSSAAPTNCDGIPTQPLAVVRGDRVGVVLMHLGGPETTADVGPYLYRLLMDPAVIDWPLGVVVRDVVSKSLARLRRRSLERAYDQIGGGSPVNRLAREQAENLEYVLNTTCGIAADVTFRTYIAMRHGKPTPEEAIAAMQADGITKVVLLPLFPQYAEAATGASLAYWRELQRAGHMPDWPTTAVLEYAAHPKYIQAISERIDEALQRFPERERAQVPLLFSARSTPARELFHKQDPYCCLVHATVDQVMTLRGDDLPYYVAFQGDAGLGEGLTPRTIDQLKALARLHHRAVLIVPVSFTTDHVQTAYKLDIEIREEAETLGFDRFEVTAPLNCHALFIEALTEITMAQLAAAAGAATGDGVVYQGIGIHAGTPVQPFTHDERFTRCHQCSRIAEARCWAAAHHVGPPSIMPAASE